MPVDIVTRKAARKISRQELKKIALRVLELVKQDRAELSVSLVDNKEIQALNAQFRKKDAPTDVLSFPVEDGLAPDVRLLGDVIISVEKAEEQAVQRKRSLDEEIVTLLVHGILHLIGYDHERSARDARIMGRLEKKIHRALCEQGLLRV
jgi:probable rRNA maturation factor